MDYMKYEKQKELEVIYQKIVFCNYLHKAHGRLL